MKLLVTGAAGFIGFHTATLLLQQGHEVVGLDNLNDYYDPKLKTARLNLLSQAERFRFVRVDITDRDAMQNLFASELNRSIMKVIFAPPVTIFAWFETARA